MAFNYTRYGSYLGSTFGVATKNGIFNTNASQIIGDFAPPGQAEFTTPGTYSWTAPLGVTSVSVVCVGGGGSGAAYFGCAGAGGGLAYKNNISVTPGQSYTVIVGVGGTGLPDNVMRNAASGSIASCNGGSSSFTNNIITVTATGGQHGYGLSGAQTRPNGGSPSGTFDGGGSGGTCEGNYSSNVGLTTSGGGGAGGYSGNGGKGAGSLSSNGTYVQPTSGTGGGGGGAAGMATSTGTAVFSGAGGGGVGLLGEGTSGSAGITDTTSAAPDATQVGSGGSGGADGNVGTINKGGTGGLYGGAGGSGNGDSSTSIGGDGAGGAVRIIWGVGRAFPSTGTGNE